MDKKKRKLVGIDDNNSGTKEREIRIERTDEFGRLGRTSELEQIFTHADANFFNKDKGGYSTNVALSPMSDEDSELNAGMQEAMYRSNLEMSDTEFVRKEIPLFVVPSQSLLKLKNPLAAFTQLQHVVFEEERVAYKQAIMQNTRLSPALNVLQKMLYRMLVEEAKRLEAELLDRGSDLHPEFPLLKYAKTDAQGIGAKFSHQQPTDGSTIKLNEVQVHRSKSKGSIAV